jgi:hypothetical protein
VLNGELSEELNGKQFKEFHPPIETFAKQFERYDRL